MVVTVGGTSSSAVALDVEPATAGLFTMNSTGGIAANVEYAGLAPGYVGLWQVNVRLPSTAPTGEQPVVLETWTQRSNIATVFVR